MLPADLLLGQGLSGQNVRFEPPAVQNLLFLEIAYVNQVLSILLQVLDLEVEPLQMPPGVGINPHEEIILVLSYLFYPNKYFNRAIQVPAFEHGVKLQIIFGLPMLPAKLPVRELYVVWRLDVVVRKRERFVVPRVVRVLVLGAQVADLCSW